MSRPLYAVVHPGRPLGWISRGGVAPCQVGDSRVLWVQDFLPGDACFARHVAVLDDRVLVFALDGYQPFYLPVSPLAGPYLVLLANWVQV